MDFPLVESIPQAVGHGPLSEERGPAPADVLEDRRWPHDVQVGVLLAGEGGRRQVLCRRARSDRVGGLFAEPGNRAGDRRGKIVGDGDPFEVRRISALSVRIASRSSGLRRDSRSSRSPIDGASAMIRRKASVVTQKPAGTRMPSIRESSPRCAPLPPTTATCDLVDLLEIQHVVAHPSTFPRALRAAFIPTVGRADRPWFDLRRALSAHPERLHQDPHPGVAWSWRKESIVSPAVQEQGQGGVAEAMGLRSMAAIPGGPSSMAGRSRREPDAGIMPQAVSVTGSA